MSIPITITLNSVVGTPGPFDLYSNTDTYTNAFQTGITLSSLLAGYGTSNVPNNTTNVKIKSTGCSFEIIKPIVGLPTFTPTPTITSTPTVTPTPTATLILPPNTSSVNMITGLTLNAACTGKTSITFYYSGVSFPNGTVLYTNSSLTTVAPQGNAGGARYYNATDWNTIYTISDSGGHAYDSGETCPPPTANPWSQSNIKYSDASDVCNTPLAYGLTISGYGGTDIFNCSSLHDLPNDITNNQTNQTSFWLTDGGVYKQEFLYTYSNQSAIPVGSKSVC
jgi:hypothetical protein